MKSGAPGTQLLAADESCSTLGVLDRGAPFWKPRRAEETNDKTGEVHMNTLLAPRTAINWKERSAAAGIHLAISLAVALMAALLVFGVWYRYPYREISGGRDLFLILVMVDVAIGPLITFAIFNRAKPATELRRDLAIVGLIQVLALAYGLWSVAVARPIHLVFEVDRFRVVHAVDVPEELLGLQPAGVEAMPWRGPTLLAVRSFRSDQERADATVVALRGLPLGARPDFWEPYEAAKARVLAAAKPVSELKRRFRDRAGDIDAALQAAGRSADRTVYLPMVGRKAFWTAFIDPDTGKPVGFMPLDAF
jgi:hypothetical protein